MINTKNHQPLIAAILIPFVAAIIGNATIPTTSIEWYEQLNHPWYKLPLWASILVAFSIYLGYGIVIFQAWAQKHWTVVALASAVLFANEGWNYVMFGIGNLSLLFYVTMAFAALVAVQTAFTRKLNRLCFIISIAYLAWVTLYDLPWMYFLMTNN